MERKILLNPGPVTISERVRKALLWPDICHREKEFSNMLYGIRKDLTSLVHKGDKYNTVLISGSGTAAMDAVMSSIVHNNARILIITNGAYGERFSKIAKKYNIDFFEYNQGWGKKIDLKKIDIALESDMFSHVFVIHHETTTGILNPIKEIGKLAKKYGIIYVVDAISSIGGMPIDVDECNIDYILGTANKCIQGIPGISFVICKKDEIKDTRKFGRSFYLNLYDEWQYQNKKGLMRFTSPTYTIFALRVALDELRDEGVLNRYDRYCRSYDVLEHGFCNDFGFKLFETPVKSKLLATFCSPLGFSFNSFHDKLYDRGFTIYPGKLFDERTFRISVIGDIDYKVIECFLKNAKEVLNVMKCQ